MSAKQFLREHRIYEDEVIYNTVDESVGRLSDLMDAYAKERIGEILKMYVPDGNPQTWFDKIKALK